MIRTLSSREWPAYKKLRLQSLADSSDAFGSTLAKDQCYSDDTWSSRLAPNQNSWDLPLVAEVDGKLVGLAWGRIEKTNPALANLY